MSKMRPEKPWTPLETSIRFLPAHMQTPIIDEIEKLTSINKLLAGALEQLERKMAITFKRHGAIAWGDICTAAQWLEKANADVSASHDKEQS